MTHGKEPLNTVPGIVQRATSDLLAEAIVAPTSHEVSDLIGEFAGGRVKVFGEIRRGVGQPHIPLVSAQRTDIQAGSELVSVHKGLNNAAGVFAAARRFSQIEVITGTEKHSLTVKVNPTTSPYNPAYIFLDGEDVLGLGYGQRIDLILASELLAERIDGGDGYVPDKVVEWIKGKLS